MEKILFWVLASSVMMMVTPALAVDALVCPELTSLQRWAGYLSWLGFLKGLGAVIAAVGVLYFTWGVLSYIVRRARVILEVASYALSISLIASGDSVSPEYLTWTVLAGCVLFAGSVFITMWVHSIKGDERVLSALFMVVWGAVAIFYNMSEAGVLAMMALVTLLGFSVVVREFSYSIGFDDDASIPPVTIATIFLLTVFVCIHAFVPDAPEAVKVFELGAFWVNSIVAYTGLLIMSNRYYGGTGGLYALNQLIMIVVSLMGVMVGMTWGIPALAGVAGTFLVLYLASKPLEVPVGNKASFGVMLMISGGILFGAWWFANQNLDIVERYFMTMV